MANRANTRQGEATHRPGRSSLAALEELVEVLLLGESQLGTDAITGAVDTRTRDVEVYGDFFSGMLEIDEHAEYHVSVGQQRIIAAQLFDIAGIHRDESTDKRPGVVIQELRMMQDIGIHTP